MAYSIDLRRKAVEMVNEKRTPEQVSRLLGLGYNTVRQWYNKLKKTGNLENAPLERAPKKINPVELERYIEENPLALDIEVAKKFNVSPSTIRYWYRKLDITRKKAQTTYKEADEELKEEFREQIAEINVSNRVYVDESGIEEYYTRRYGHAKRGKKI